MTEKLETEQEKVEKKQTRNKIDPIRFKDEVINKIQKGKIDFGPRSYKDYPFNVSKDTHQKGLFLRVYKGSNKDTFTKRVLYIRFWFNGKSDLHSCGMYSQSFGTKECDEYLIKLHKDHTDPKTRYWIKSPNETRRDDKRLVEKPDTTIPKGYTINEVIEAYCGAEIPGEEIERGFSKDRKDGYRASTSCRICFRCMAGYNHRQSLVKFTEDEDGLDGEAIKNHEVYKKAGVYTEDAFIKEEMKQRISDEIEGMGGEAFSKSEAQKLLYEQTEKEYKELAECIKMGQVSSDRIQKHFVKDPKFEKWYIKNALGKSLNIE